MLRKFERGFTLIEIVIVLGIASLIILIVLQAVTAAQRSQRDAARKQEGGQVASLLEQYASNNDGKYPATLDLLAVYDNAQLVSGTPKYKINTTLNSCGALNDDTPFEINYKPRGTAGNYRGYDLEVCTNEGAPQATKITK
jgi:prepilin-type N-terminal cleavage/methylation domain-containing protein